MESCRGLSIRTSPGYRIRRTAGHLSDGISHLSLTDGYFVAQTVVLVSYLIRLPWCWHYLEISFMLTVLLRSESMPVVTTAHVKRTRSAAGSTSNKASGAGRREAGDAIISKRGITYYVTPSFCVPEIYNAGQCCITQIMQRDKIRTRLSLRHEQS
jgi:hypothetical protein